MIKYFRIVNPTARGQKGKGSVSCGMSPVLGSTAMTLPVKSGMTQTQRVIISTAYVAQYIATWTYSGGLPLPCVSQVTRMRHPRNRMASIGAKFTVYVAVFKISWIGRLSYLMLKLSAAVRQSARA